MSRHKVTTEEFITRARAVHGDKYDYSKTVYRRSSEKVCIICPIHGEFWQTPGNHLSGKGCRACAGNEPYTTETFIEAAKKAHGDKFDYSKVEYKSAHTPVTIVCRRCGRVFQQDPMAHLDGRGCAHCSKVDSHKYRRDHAAEVKKREATMRERYGVSHALHSEVFKEKARETSRERFGVDHAMQNPEVREKARETLQKRYGVDVPSQSDEAKRKTIETCIERYGSTSPLNAPEVRAKGRKTMLERYGAETTFESEELKKRARETCVERYGAPNPMQNAAVREKGVATRLGHGTAPVSGVEDRAYEMLCAKFGEDDVERQHFDMVRYPFACDFHIKSRDLFIEINVWWQHGQRFFDARDDECYERLRDWVTRGDEHPSYRFACYVWTDLDVRRRIYASTFKLNYAVFWQSDLSDLQKWIEGGCPDRRDWSIIADDDVDER